MPYALNGNAHIYYEVEGEGPPLILQHGFTSDIQDWREFGWVTALRDDYQLVLIDARGHGESEKSYDPMDYQLDVLAADVVAVLDKLRIEKAHFFGYSWGTDIGCALAKEAPQRLWSLVLGGMESTASLDWGDEATKQFDGGMAAYIEKYIFPPGRIITPESKARLLALDPQALIAVAIAGSIAQISLVDILPKIDLPCLIYAGENDQAQQVADAVKQMPGVRFFSLPGLGHGQAFRYSHRALPPIQKFLQEVTPRAEQNRALVRRVVGTFDSANYAGLDRLYHADWSCPGQANQHGAEGVRQLIGQIFRVFADANAEIEEIAADEETVTTRWVFKGTHTGSWMGIAPSGARVRVSGATVDRIADGKIVESHIRYDPADLRQQLGIAPEKSL